MAWKGPGRTKGSAGSDSAGIMGLERAASTSGSARDDREGLSVPRPRCLAGRPSAIAFFLGAGRAVSATALSVAISIVVLWAVGMIFVLPAVALHLGLAPGVAGAWIGTSIAAPMVGGLVTSFLMELLVHPAIYYLWKRKDVVEGPATLTREPPKVSAAVAT